MKQKSKYQRELEKEPFYNIKDEDFGEEVPEGQPEESTEEEPAEE